jgi:hypothetical protein
LAQTLRPLLEARLVEVARPVRRSGILIAHKANLPGKRLIANRNDSNGCGPKLADEPKPWWGASNFAGMG